MLKKLHTLSTLKSKNTSELLVKKVMLTLVAGACFFAVQNPVMAGEVTVSDTTVLPDTTASDGLIKLSSTIGPVICPSADSSMLIDNSKDYGTYIFAGGVGLGNAVEGKSVTMKNGTVGAAFGAGAIDFMAGIGSASGNKLTVSGGVVNVAAVGGIALDSGSASGNEVNITGGKVLGITVGGITGGITGGFAAGAGDASNNVTNISGGEHEYGGSGVNPVYGVSGGYSQGGNTIGNKLIISGGKVVGTISGGYAAGAGLSSNNEVVIIAGNFACSRFSRVYGGYSEDGVANANSVVVNSGEFDNGIYGGCANGNGTANENVVTINGGRFAEVIGGYSKNDNAVNNTVELGGGTIDKVVYGGRSDNDAKEATTGNTLKVSGLNIKALNIKNFEKLNFFIPSSATDGSTMLNLTDTDDTDISATTLMAGVVAIEGDSKLKAGDTVNLIKKDAGTLITTKADGKEMTYDKLAATEGVSVDYEFDILKQDDQTLVAKINAAPETSLNPQTKSLAETQLAGMGLLTSGMDMLSGAGIANAVEVTDGAGSEFALIGQMGASDMKYKTGSHVDLNGWNLGLGFAKTTENNAGKLTFGTIVGYGKGSYDSYVDDGVHGEGDTDYLGISLFAHQANEDGLYYEGSIGAGRVNSDYKSNDLVGAGGAKVHENYDSDSTYVAAHLGLGKKIDVSDKAKLDVYGKYFYAHQGGDDAKLATGETYHFDAVDSNRIRLGARYEIENGKAATEAVKGEAAKALSSIYVGAAYEYEFSGEARGVYKGMETPSPSLKGSSGMLELGWKVKPSAASPLTIDLSANGWCGQKEGYGLKANFLWNF